MENWDYTGTLSQNIELTSYPPRNVNVGGFNNKQTHITIRELFSHFLQEKGPE